MALDDFDRALIAATQGGLPLVPRPYDAVGERLGVSGQQVRERLKQMLETGLIRRIGAVPNHYRLGFTANGMSVWNVDDVQVDALGERIGELPGVSHCYRRPRHLPKASPGRSQDAESPSEGDGVQSTASGGIYWPYNLFAMLHGRTRAEVEQQAEQVRALLGAACTGHDILYSTAILKKPDCASRKTEPCSASASTCASSRMPKKTGHYPEAMHARRGSGGAPGPVVIWNLIRRCNLTCKHCYALSADHDYEGELSTSEVFGVMDDLKD